MKRIGRRSSLSSGQALLILLSATAVILWVVPHLVGSLGARHALANTQRNEALIISNRIFDAVGELAITGDVTPASVSLGSQLPVDVYEQASSEFAAQLGAFVAGGRNDVDITVSVPEAGSVERRWQLVDTIRQLASLPTREMDNIDDFDASVRNAFNTIRSGDVPEWLPTITASPQSALSLSEWILGSIEYPSPVLSSRIRAHLALGDVRGALAWSAIELVPPQDAIGGNGEAIPILAQADRVLAAQPSAHDASSSVSVTTGTVMNWFESLHDISSGRPWTPVQIVILLLALAAFLAVASFGEREFAGAAAVILVVLALVAVIWAPLLASGHVPSASGVAPDVTALDAALSGYRSGLASAAAHVARSWAAMIGIAVVVAALALFRRALGWRVPRAIYTGGLIGVVILAILAIRQPSVPEIQVVRLCNGTLGNCELRLDELSFVGASDSLGGAESNWLYPRQVLSLEEQLHAGATLVDIRLSSDSVDQQLTASQDSNGDAEAQPNRPALDTDLPVFDSWPTELRNTILHVARRNEACAVQCALGDTPVPEALDALASYLGEHPGLFVTVLIDDRISAASLETLLDDAGLTDQVFAQEPGRRWPKLGDLLDDGKRVLLIARHGGPPPPWLNNLRTQVGVIESVDRECKPAGPSGAPFTMFDASASIAAPGLSELAAGPTVAELTELLANCGDQNGRLPSLVLTDLFVSADVLGPDPGSR